MQKNTVEAGGSVEESAKGLRSIAVIFPMMTFLMLTTLMVQLQSFQKMLLEISVAPIDKGGRLAWSELPRDPNRQFFAVINVWLMSFSQPSPHASMGPETPVVSGSANACIAGLDHALMELMAGALIEAPLRLRRGDRGSC